MKFFVASDIHGSSFWLKETLKKFDESGAERLLLLGDLLYHGPRNDLPKEYDPKECIRLLNERKDEILSVRGNCDADVDQMVLDFPIMASYAIVYLKGRLVFMTHGDCFNDENVPPLKDSDIILHGHTHLLKAEVINIQDRKIFHLNPGSVSLPKGGNPNSYGILTEDFFEIFDFDGKKLNGIKFDD